MHGSPCVLRQLQKHRSIRLPPAGTLQCVGSFANAPPVREQIRAKETDLSVIGVRGRG